MKSNDIDRGCCYHCSKELLPFEQTYLVQYQYKSNSRWVKVGHSCVECVELESKQARYKKHGGK